MKTEPTAIDREAATLFTPAPGMRVWLDMAVCRFISDPCDETWTACECCDVPDIDQPGNVAPYAIDTDDPATVGCMLAQVGEHGSSTWLQPLWRVSIPADAPYHGETMATVTGRVWSVMTSTGSAGDGPTEGAALVAAMKALGGMK